MILAAQNDVEMCKKKKQHYDRYIAMINLFDGYMATGQLDIAEKTKMAPSFLKVPLKNPHPYRSTNGVMSFNILLFACLTHYISLCKQFPDCLHLIRCHAPACEFSGNLPEFGFQFILSYCCRIRADRVAESEVLC